MQEKYIVNKKTGDVMNYEKCFISYPTSGRVRVYTSDPHCEKLKRMAGEDCVVVEIKNLVRATVSHPTFRHLVKQLGTSEGIPLSDYLTIAQRMQVAQ